LKSPPNNLWFGFRVPIYNKANFPEGGIQKYVFQNDNISSYLPQSTSLVSNRITSMKIASDKSLWFTTGIDDPLCENCYAGIGVLTTEDNFIVSSKINSDLLPNDFFTFLNENHKGEIYVASELSIYKVKLLD